MIKEDYRLGKAIVPSENFIFHDFATRVENNGVIYEVVKWTTDYETMTRTIELKRFSEPKKN